MKKITNLIIVDASGSMHRKTQQVKDGLNEILQDIRKDMKKTKGEAKIRTIVLQFSSQGWGSNGNDWYEILIDTKKRKEITFDCVENYNANGGTALFDAIGLGFGMVGKKQDGVFVSILTDGDENSSKEFKQEDVQKLLKKADKKKWGVTFMGTTQAAVEAAKSWGIKSSNSLVYADSAEGTKMANVSRMASKAMYFSSVMEGEVKTRGLVADQEEEDVEVDSN